LRFDENNGKRDEVLESEEVNLVAKEKSLN
jgi:hypothetical protein